MSTLFTSHSLGLRRCATVLSLCLLASGLAVALTPAPNPADAAIALEEAIPRQFGSWREVRSPVLQMALTPQQQRAEDGAQQTYDQVLMRSFSDGDATVMLALAYGANLSQEDKIHRPELCYAAQGFRLTRDTPVSFPLQGTHAGEPIRGKRLIAQHDNRRELVSYWIRVGDIYSTSALQSRLHILGQGLRGHVADGILVRVSQIVSPFETDERIEEAFARQERFAAELVAGLPDTRSKQLLAR